MCEDWFYYKEVAGKKIVSDFNSKIIWTQLYNNDHSIFEDMVRQGLKHNLIKITSHQVNRIINPCLSDNNRTLLHFFAANHFRTLESFFMKTNVAEEVQGSTRLLFGYCTGKRTPLDVALENNDFASFRLLLHHVVTLQNREELNFLVGKWVVDALEMEMDLLPLFESNLCTSKIEKGKF